MMMKFTHLASALTLTLLASPALSQTLLSGDHSVDGRLCVGANCTGFEAFSSLSGLKIKQTAPGIAFDDTSTSSQPDRDWAIEIGTTSLGSPEYFGIRDVTANRLPFQIRGDAPENSLYVSLNGNIGLGTTVPEQPLHVVTSISGQGMVLEKPAPSPSKWETSVGSFGYVLSDDLALTSPVQIANGAPNAAIRINSNGNTGLGTSSPEGKLHVAGNGVQLTYFESENGGPVQVRFRTDSENRRFLAVNNANEVQSQLIFKDDEILLTGTTDSGSDIWLAVGPGGVVSPPPTCDDDEPCDRVFDPTVFTVPPIAERAQYMWDNMHLPAIGPTSGDTPINLTEKMGGVIHELEVAHIYIEELNADLQQAQAERDELRREIDSLRALMSENSDG